MVSTTWRQWRNRSTKAAKVARKRPHRQPRCRLHLEVLEDRQLLSVSLTGVPNWIEQGPGPILNDGNTHALPDSRAVGAVESVAVEPLTGPAGGSGYIAYAGTVNGGVWRSDDINAADPKTINWRPLTDQQPSLATRSMALDPLDP